MFEFDKNNSKILNNIKIIKPFKKKNINKMGIDTSQIVTDPSKSRILSQSSSRHRIHLNRLTNPLMTNFSTDNNSSF